MIDVGVVGCGISALMLTLALRERGVPVTLYADRSQVGYRLRLPNTVARYGRSLEIERRLGVDRWCRRELGIERVDVAVAGADIQFSGPLPGGGSCVDFRSLLPQLLTGCISRGARLEPAARSDAVLRAGSARHDLTVVCSGASSHDLFPPDATRSTDRPPPRTLLGAVCDAGELGTQPLLTIDVTPGAGEVFTFPCFSRRRQRTAVLVEAVPGGPLDDMVQRGGVTRRDGACALLASVLDEYAPRLPARADRGVPVIAADSDVLRGAIRPTVRRFWTRLRPDTYAVALGDAWVLNDPIAGVGANVAIQCADRLATLVADAELIDETFCRDAERALWEIAGPACWWTEAQLDPPPALAAVLDAATRHQEVADAHIANLTDLPRMRRTLADEISAERFIAGATRGRGRSALDRCEA